MKKKILAFFSMLLLCISMTFPVSAAGERLVDDADLLSESEESALLNQLDEISERQDMDVVVVTVDSLGGKSAMSYADDYYDYNGYAPDGILLLVSMEEREWHITTTGYGITAFTDWGLENIANAFLDDLSDGQYYDAFSTYAEMCDDYITQAKAGEPYDVTTAPAVSEPFPLGRNLLISIVIGVVVALIVTGIMRSQLKSVRPQRAASQYMIQGSMRVTESRDMFLYRHVDRRRREKNESGGGSKTHRSSSGRSHGGRGGKF